MSGAPPASWLELLQAIKGKQRPLIKARQHVQASPDTSLQMELWAALADHLGDVLNDDDDHDGMDVDFDEQEAEGQTGVMRAALLLPFDLLAAGSDADLQVKLCPSV